MVRYPQHATANEVLKAVLELAREKMVRLRNATGNKTMNASAKVGAPAVAIHIKLLHNYDRQVREQATKTLIELSTEAVMPLIAALRDEDDDVRMCAAWALGCIGDSRALRELERLERIEWGRGWGGWGAAGIAREAARKIRQRGERLTPSSSTRLLFERSSR